MMSWMTCPEREKVLGTLYSLQHIDDRLDNLRVVQNGQVIV